jgi:hypothetical protein
MTHRYDITLATPTGIFIEETDEFSVLSYVKNVNGTGWFTIRLPAQSIDSSLLAVDQNVRIYRYTVAGLKQLDFFGFLRSWRVETDARLRDWVVMSGPDQNDLLTRRIVAYDADSALSEIKTSIALDDGLKDVFDTNFLASATDANRDISGYGTTVDTDETVGPSMGKEFSWRQVSRVIGDLNAASRMAGTEVFYEIAINSIGINGTPNLEFRTHINQPGINLTVGTANKPAIFSLQMGNLETPVLAYDYTREITVVYAGGKGEGAERTIIEVENADRVSASVWNRREAFINASNQTTTDGLTATAQALLDQKRPTKRFTGTLISNEQAPYNDLWGLGDKVSVAYKNERMDAVVRQVQVKVTPETENITARVNEYL